MAHVESLLKYSSDRKDGKRLHRKLPVNRKRKLQQKDAEEKRRKFNKITEHAVTIGNLYLWLLHAGMCGWGDEEAEETVSCKRPGDSGKPFLRTFQLLSELALLEITNFIMKRKKRLHKKLKKRFMMQESFNKQISRQ